VPPPPIQAVAPAGPMARPPVVAGPAPAVPAATQPPEPRRRRRGLGLLLLAAIVIAGVAFVLVAKPFGNLGLPGSPGVGAAGPGEIFLEPATAVGPDPFMPSVATATAAPSQPQPASPSVTVTATPSSAPSASASEAIAVRTIPGGEVGLYGGTRNNTECDKEQLVTFLEQNPDKAAAWAAVQGIQPSDIRSFVATLTPVVLQHDTRVTNHGFRNGVADARQSVLQAGTAVLLDDRGVPRARCFCGNPLLAPIPAPVTPTYTGDKWPGFDPEKLQVISPAPAPLAQIPVVDNQTGEVFARPIGSEGTIDVALVASPPPSVEPTATAPASEIPAPTQLPGPGAGDPVQREPAFPSDLTAIGAVSSNSVDPNFPTGLAVDLDATTSWFSKGPHTNASVIEYTWSVDGPVEIGAIAVAGNAQNATPEFRSNFGFDQVDIDILSEGAVVTTATYALDGTPDPDVFAQFPPGTIGDTVRLRFSGPESLDCGGAAEVLVLGADWESDIETMIEEGLGDLFGI
jgi:hypothetical protein